MRVEERRKTCVRTKFEVARTSDDFLVVRVVKMTVEDLFGESERTVKPRDIYENNSNDMEKTRYLSRTTRRLSSIRW